MGVIQNKVLIVGCPTAVSVELCAQLGRSGMSVVAQDFRDIESTVRLLVPDLAIVELFLGNPQLTISRVRGDSDLPILLLVPPDARPNLAVEALRSGADDVVVLPVDTDELVLRAQSILRRCEFDRLVQVHDVVVDEAAYLAWRGEHALHLTPIEFRLLVGLAHNVGVVLSKRELLGLVWGFDDFDVNLVEVHVSALRRKLEVFGPRLIQTVRSHGYVIRPEPVERRRAIEARRDASRVTA